MNTPHNPMNPPAGLRRWLSPALIALSLAVAACGGGDDSQEGGGVATGADGRYGGGSATLQGETFPLLSFQVKDTDAVLTGAINAQAITAYTAMRADHPEVKRLVLKDVPGSIDDEANLELSRKIRKDGLATHVPANGEIASGGTDLFCAGTTRTAEAGARVGVHSWSGGDDLQGDKLVDDKENPAHKIYLDYYKEMGIPAAFYWFTLKAAPPEGVHWMTPKELKDYGLLTE